MAKRVFQVVVGFLSFVGLIVTAVAVWISTLFVTPDISWLKKENPQKTAFMELRERQWKESGSKLKVRQIWVPLSRISPYVQEAVVTSEDDKFWQHSGFDLGGIQEAFEKDIRSGKIRSGGSTITQQLAKNLFLSPEKTLSRKLKEAVIAFRLERELGKPRILELYLNVAEWGAGIFGIEAASQAWFGKTSSRLTPIEACRLAIALPSPLRINPSGNSEYVVNRAESVCAIMQKRNKEISIRQERDEEPTLVESASGTPVPQEESSQPEPIVPPAQDDIPTDPDPMPPSDTTM